MAVEVRQNKSTAEKIADRLRNSGEGSNPNVHTVHGEGPTRTHTNVHHSGHYVQPNTQAKPSDSPIANNNPGAKNQGGSVG